MTRRLTWVMCAVAAIAAVTGCAKKGLEGKWIGNTTRAGMAMNIILTIGADGKFQQDSVITGGPIQTTLVATGTWVAKDNKLTMKPTLLVNGSSRTPMANASLEFTYKLDGDSLTLTGGSQSPVTLKRSKE